MQGVSALKPEGTQTTHFPSSIWPPSQRDAVEMAPGSPEGEKKRARPPFGIWKGGGGSNTDLLLGELEVRLADALEDWLAHPCQPLVDVLLRHARGDPSRQGPPDHLVQAGQSQHAAQLVLRDPGCKVTKNIMQAGASCTQKRQISRKETKIQKRYRFPEKIQISWKETDFTALWMCAQYCRL